MGNCIDLKQFDDAIALLSQCWRSTPRRPKIYNARGLCLSAKRRFDHAKDDFEQVVRMFPQFPGAQERLGAIRAKLGSPAK